MEPKDLKKHHGVLKSIDLESDGLGKFRHSKLLNLNFLILKIIVIIPALLSSWDCCEVKLQTVPHRFIYGLKVLQQVGLRVAMRKNFPLNFLLSIVIGSFSSYEK